MHQAIICHHLHSCCWEVVAELFNISSGSEQQRHMSYQQKEVMLLLMRPGILDSMSAALKLARPRGGGGAHPWSSP
jgi:hypothetical protein